jgi:nicotinate-nucleotide adenylyltransferase
MHRDRLGNRARGLWSQWAIPMTTLCFGGSFNPIHHGHLIVARAAAETIGANRILLIPSAQSPHKTAVDLATAPQRLAMARLAIAGSDLFDCDDLEIVRGGRSFTIETARALRQRGWSEVRWLIGADMVPTLPNWREPAALLREVQFVIADRPGHSIDWRTVPAELVALEHNVVSAPRIDISSTQIRDRVAAGRRIDYLTPPAVVRYIDEQNLYRLPAGTK